MISKALNFASFQTTAVMLQGLVDLARAETSSYLDTPGISDICYPGYAFGTVTSSIHDGIFISPTAHCGKMPAAGALTYNRLDLVESRQIKAVHIST